MSRKTAVLFVTWDGPHSTYLEGLFLPIFARLRDRGFAFHVLQFTWADAAERAKLARACEAIGVTYRSVTIWRRPVSVGSLATALWGRTHVRHAVKALGIELLMPRSTLPALAAIAAAGSGRKRLPVILDADGLPHDERVEFDGASANGAAYRVLRALETWSVRRAVSVIVRTQAARQILAGRAALGSDDARFHLVANPRDPRIFALPQPHERAATRAELGVAEGAPLLVYAGSSLQGKYRGGDMLRLFRSVRERRPDARLLILMPSLEEARTLLAAHLDLASTCILRSAAPSEIPRWIGAADLGVALIHASFSMQAVAAIKLGEYLLCGVPVLASKGVGDSDTQVDPTVGRLLTDPDEESLAAAAWLVDTVLPDRDGFRERCRAVGLAHFSLDGAIQGYEDALRAALEARA